MSISEVIHALDAIKSSHGDLAVYMEAKDFWDNLILTTVEDVHVRQRAHDKVVFIDWRR